MGSPAPAESSAPSSRSRRWPISSGRRRRLIGIGTGKFHIRTVAVEPGERLPYREADWRDALVLVKSGEIVLDTRCGRSFFFPCGSVLWLAELPLENLRNRGREPAVLVSAARHSELR